MMTVPFSCPVCGEALSGEQTVRCPAGHSFDRNKYGYWNLLLSNQSGKKRHGDDRQMVLSRSQFLEKGHYAPVRQALLEGLQLRTRQGMTILDAGCGEGWYTAWLDHQLQALQPVTVGVDISRDALRQAAKRGLNHLAVASTARIPMADGSCDSVLNVFSPEELAEFHRVLAPGGLLIRALPLEKHLWQLKTAVYDTPYENPAPVTELPGFRLLRLQDVTYSIHLPCQEDIWSLFTMTPYYYKTGRTDQEKLQALTSLDTDVAIGVLTYEKV